MPSDAKAHRLLSYQRHISQLQRYIDTLKTQSNYWSARRLWSFFGGGLLGLFALQFVSPAVGNLILGVSLGLFVQAVYRHRRIEARLLRYQHWQQIKRQHIAQMTVEWDHLPTPIAVNVLIEHPFAYDINLVGARSLLHLLDTAITHEGGQRLADWLLQTVPSPEQTQKRQAFVQQTRALWRFRDKLRLQARLVGTQQRIHGQYVLDWFTQNPNDGWLGRVLAIAVVLAVFNAVLLAAFWARLLPPVFIVTAGLYITVLYQQNEAITQRFKATRSLHRQLSRLQAVFAFLENTHHPLLDERLQPFHQDKPSKALRRLTQLMVAASTQQNPFLAFFLNLVMPYDLTIAYLLDRQKVGLKSHIENWMAAWFELEALNALANFAYLNPQQIFPQFEETCGLEATAMGHPLLKDELRVANNFSLGHTHDVVIITGSNMAGKSTFLRTLGANMALAYAGGAVEAEALKLSWFRLFTCIKVSDSINDGISYFYAEVRRLKALLDALERDHPYPLFFMIDEIFKGTNNRERLIGSRAYIRTVAQKHGVGLVATHDLELVKLADEFPAIRNFHFREEVIGGRMVFDYLIRQGPSPTTNALKIMAIEGLPTE